MGVSLTDIELFAHKALDLVAHAAPLASIGGPTAGAIGAMVGNAAAALDGMITEVENDAAVIASGDLPKIRALQAELQAKNKVLLAQIDAS